MLTDAASTLAPDDVNLLQMLHEAGVAAQVLLSKADLLIPADRQHAARYVQEQARRELGLDVPVHQVSTVGADEALLTGWFDKHLAPLLERHLTLARESVDGKMGLLRGSVSAVLETMLSRQGGSPAPERPAQDVAEARRSLGQAGDAVRRPRPWPSVRRSCRLPRRWQRRPSRREIVDVVVGLCQVQAVAQGGRVLGGLALHGGQGLLEGGQRLGRAVQLLE